MGPGIQCLWAVSRALGPGEQSFMRQLLTTTTSTPSQAAPSHTTPPFCPAVPIALEPPQGSPPTRALLSLYFQVPGGNWEAWGSRGSNSSTAFQRTSRCGI